MRDDLSIISSMIIFAFLAFFIGTLVGREIMRGVIVNKGYGLYCSTTGDFAFKGECEND